jgi:hypothetical protein
MMRYTDVVSQDAPRALVLNGQPLSFTAGTSRDPVKVVLDEYARRCAERGVLGDRGTLREEEGEGERRRGFVACFDAGRPVGAEETLTRVRAFLETMDLARVGGFRYVYAEPGATLTRFVTLSSDGPVRVDALLPAEGDAPGRDVGGLERPPGTRRLLSAFEAGQPFGLVIYGGGAEPADATAAWYRARLPAAGWTIAGETAAGGGHAFELRRGGRRVTLVVFQGGASILWGGHGS